MLKNLQTRLIIVGVICFAGIAALTPTLLWYLKPADLRHELELEKSIPKWLIRLGLDLRGGTHLLLELDVSKLNEQAGSQKVTVADALDRAAEIVRNRVDQFGVSEPYIAKQGDRFIVVQLPGISDPRRAKDIIGKTALLEFRMVNDSKEAQDASAKIRELGDPFASDGSVKPEAQKLLPKGAELFKARDESNFYVLKSTPELTGAYVVNAKVEMGQYSYPHVSFVLNTEGGKLFAHTTEVNAGKSMAIVLDGVVQSAPRINERIPGGRGIIEGNFAMEDARDLALVLRAGALPAPIRIAEERTIGPGLGEDSIRKGIMGSLIGCALIFVFMGFYYKTSGMVANLCLVLNIILTLAGLALLNATMTLPGLAGLALTVGMAVDANVLIFERIREELHLGKTVRVCLDTGYEKALAAIIDSNVTTIIAAVFLFQFGSGPIKGFAATLTLGLMVSMFTAVFVSRTLFMLYYENYMEARTISI